MSRVGGRRRIEIVKCRAPACREVSKTFPPGAAPGRHVSWIQWRGPQFYREVFSIDSKMGAEVSKGARLSCKQEERERYPSAPPNFHHAVRSKLSRSVPWKHVKAGASPATATTFNNGGREVPTWGSYPRRPGALPGPPTIFKGAVPATGL